MKECLRAEVVGADLSAPGSGGQSETDPGLCGNIATDVIQALKSNDCLCFCHCLSSVCKGEVTLCEREGRFRVTKRLKREDTGQDMVQ